MVKTMLESTPIYETIVMPHIKILIVGQCEEASLFTTKELRDSTVSVVSFKTKFEGVPSIRG